MRFQGLRARYSGMIRTASLDGGQSGGHMNTKSLRIVGANRRAIRTLLGASILLGTAVPTHATFLDFAVQQGTTPGTFQYNGNGAYVNSGGSIDGTNDAINNPII